MLNTITPELQAKIDQARKNYKKGSTSLAERKKSYIPF